MQPWAGEISLIWTRKKTWAIQPQIQPHDQFFLTLLSSFSLPRTRKKYASQYWGYRPVLGFTVFTAGSEWSFTRLSLIHSSTRSSWSSLPLGLILNLSNLWSYGRRFKTRDTLWCVVQKQRNYSYTESKRVHVQGVKMDLKLDPVGSTASYEIMNWVSIGQQWLVLGGTESV